MVAIGLGGRGEHASQRHSYDGFYSYDFESACLRHAEMYLLDIPHT